MHGYKNVLRVTIMGLVILEVTLGNQYYTDRWAVHVEGGEKIARSLAEKYGFVYLDQIMPDYYHFQHRKVAKRSIRPSNYHHRNLATDPNIKWLEQQIAKRRVKRDLHFNDPKWPIMWYLNRGRGLDMNVSHAWSMGYTGKGVVVTILDDGIEKDHPDLKNNYDYHASYDVNGHDPDPQPRYDYSNENRHGTRCAGEVAAQADNGVCNVGVAFNARIGGVRMLDGDVTDSVEAQSLSLNPQHIDIYSASWGPDDDGRTVDGPATLARKAFYDGITKGRDGKGSIFVWASGNGGRDGDNCNCDGYTNSIYTLSISSVTENGNIPWYSEACSSTLATTYSSGSGGEKQIVTTDLRKTCTENHTGTSASAPLAAGLIALGLEANDKLTWRDMQHIVVETAKPDRLKANDWVTNGVGKNVSHSFGFGLMDAGSIAALARNWTTVPAQHICEIRSPDHNRIIPTNGKITVPLPTNSCQGTANHVKYLEHVQARITMTSSRRGEIQIFLTSPAGTRSTLLAKRIRDTSREGFNNWAFMTTHNWGEYAEGTWILEIENGASSSRPVRLRDWVLVLYGTDRHPWRKKVPARPHRAPPTRRPMLIYPSQKPYTTRPSIKSTMHTNNWPSNRKIWHPYHRKFWEPYVPFNSKSSTYARHRSHHLPHPAHMCVYETLAKKSNISALQYIRMIRPNLTAAELKEWTLVVIGTGTHPIKDNNTPPVNVGTAFTCRGVKSNGICIEWPPTECKPGYFKLGDGCVAHCPEHYFGSVEAVQLVSPIQANYTRPLVRTQGICAPCHSSCLTCRGARMEECFQCSEGYERKNDFCTKKMIWDFLDPDVMKHLAWAIILCIGAILLFCVLFGLLQVRDHRKLCWSAKRFYVPDLAKGHYNGVSRNCADDPESLSESGSARTASTDSQERV
ncbi:furin-like protease kpc-1 isoform X1 [Patella vulgata]|uniref:furin-like protease kpc-1 isoform X1 n=1 Tax=Patella vulgata TaxID=6465 RepID=UPI0021808EEE|nr:furin-like protease kpc-1 isoform X1 [Patella vulgata]